MRIPLNGANNTRDLGGIPAGSSFIRRNKLIRSGALTDLSQEDVSLLQSIPLKKVVDLRTSAETLRRKDVIIDHVEYLSLPLMQERTLGVTREQTLAEQLLSMAKDPDFDAERYMQNIYADLVSSDFAADQFRRFFEILLQPCEGAILWHCSAGKDRVGVCTALLLTALGAEESVIMEDYLLTNRFVMEDVLRSAKEVCAMLGDSADPAVITEMVTVLYSVRESYLRSVFEELTHRYGSTNQFLTRRICLTPEEIHQLKEMYLES